ncbi:MAG: helix-turn-helix transcriptional regulator [Micrococcales bacterium]|nr:helix-turn-helix transcriptional regulator [Micrococcales bacterium]
MSLRGDRQEEPAEDFPHGRIHVRLDQLLEARQMTMTELAERVGITLANMSILKNGHARAVRFSTLTAICHVLDCQPGDVLTWEPPEP